MKRAWVALGVPGALGLLALVLAAVCALLEQRIEARAQSLQAETRAWRREAAQPPGEGAAPLSLAQWQERLPASSERPQRLADLIEMATRSGLVGLRTEHRLSVTDGIERLRVTMPLSGSYAQLRRFIGAALVQDPGLSLDALKIRRAGPQSLEVEAELSWSLFGRAP